MKKPQLSVRRIVGLAVAIFVGTVAAFAFATPANAHHTWVTGDTQCNTETGNWEVTWTVFNSQTNLEATLTKVVLTPASSSVTNIFVGAIVPKSPGTLVGQQILDGTATSASLAVRGHWPNGVVDGQDRYASVTMSGTCVQDHPKPHATFASACDGSVTVTLTNDADATKSAYFTVTGDGGFSKTATVAAGGSTDVLVPPASAGHIVVMEGNTKVGESSWTEPNDCAPVKVSSRSDCTTLTITLENPAGNRPVDAIVKSGDDTENVTVPPGGSKDVTFPATDGTTATVSFSAAAALAGKLAVTDVPPLTITWERPATCATTPPLPTTGSHLGPVIGAGVGLLALGAGLLALLFRRRMATESRTF